jgi:hypothetical protein
MSGGLWLLIGVGGTLAVLAIVFGHKATASTANAGEAGAPDTLGGVLRAFPDLRIPSGLTLEDLEAASEIVLAWQGREDEFADDFRGLKLAAKLCEYFRAAASARSGA